MSDINCRIYLEVVDQASDTFRHVGRSAEQLNSSFKSLVVGVSGLATSSFALYQGFQNIEHSQVALDRANLMVKRSTETLDQTQKAYNETLKKYGSNSIEAKDASDKFSIAQEALTVATERAQLAQDNVNNSMTSFSLSVVPAMVTAVASAGAAVKNFGSALTWLQAHPLVAVVTGITLAVTALVALYKNCQMFRDAIDAIDDAAASLIGHFGDVVVNGNRLNMFASGAIPILAALTSTTEKTTIVTGHLDDAVKKLIISEITLTAETQKANNAYEGFYGIVKETVELALDLTHDYNLLQAESSETLKTIATQFKEAFDVGNITQATSAVMHLASAFNIEPSDAYRIIKDYLVQIGEVAEQIASPLSNLFDEVKLNEAKVAVEETIGPLGALLDELQSHYNLDKAEEAGNKYVEAYTKAWKSDFILGCIMIAKKFALDLNIGLESAINILDELMNKMKPAAEKASTIGFGSLAGTEFAGGTYNRLPTTMPPPQEIVINQFQGWQKPNIPEVNMQFYGPIVNIEGSADRNTAAIAVESVKQVMKNVVIEASSSAADATHKQLRAETSITSTPTTMNLFKGWSHPPNLRTRDTL